MTDIFVHWRVENTNPADLNPLSVLWTVAAYELVSGTIIWKKKLWSFYNRETLSRK
jgi:hypothetical protein